MAHFEIFCFCQLLHPVEEEGTIRRKLLIARDHRDENGSFLGQKFQTYFVPPSFGNFRNYDATIVDCFRG